jgi:Flp pilus assembly protein TadG
MFAIVFGIIEYGWRLMVRQTMVQATQVAARRASLPGTTDGEIMAAVQGHMEAAGYNFSASDYSVDIVHATPGSPLETVTVAIPMARVSLTRFFGNPTGQMSVTSVVPKEGQF